MVGGELVGWTACGTYGLTPRCGLTVLCQPADNVQGSNRRRRIGRFLRGVHPTIDAALLLVSAPENTWLGLA